MTTVRKYQFFKKLGNNKNKKNTKECFKNKIFILNSFSYFYFCIFLILKEVMQYKYNAENVCTFQDLMGHFGQTT